MLAAFAGCHGRENQPSGVIQNESGDWYIVKLPSGKTVSDYFTLQGASGTVVMQNFSQKENNGIMGVAYYNRVKEGGWVVFGDGVFMYIPYAISEAQARSACNTLILNSDNTMTLEQAKQYISFLE